MNFILTTIGSLPRIDTKITWKDTLLGLFARFAIFRCDYKIQPGIYAIGNPTYESVVLVSANYKLSFDVLRKSLKNIDAWILILDTKGINVWCAAGKGTFGTQEILNRIELTKLKQLVNHRELIIPQLGAPGVSAHEVKKQSGFSVIYAPVHASDLPLFLSNNKQATASMREMLFPLLDRIKLIPAEIVVAKIYLLVMCVVFFLLSGVTHYGYDVSLVLKSGVMAVINILFSYFSAVIFGPLLLPWLPGRSFSLKGFWLGIIAFFVAFPLGILGTSWLENIAWFLLYTSIASFAFMNFTGASTYTSFSGVEKEMRIAVPLQLIAFVVGVILWLLSRLI